MSSLCLAHSTSSVYNSPGLFFHPLFSNLSFSLLQPGEPGRISGEEVTPSFTEPFNLRAGRGCKSSQFTSPPPFLQTKGLSSLQLHTSHDRDLTTSPAAHSILGQPRILRGQTI